MKSFEMFTEDGDKACESLVNSIIEKYKETKITDIPNLKKNITTDIAIGMNEISNTHLEVFDSEPPMHICDAINNWFFKNCNIRLDINRFEIPYIK